MLLGPLVNEDGSYTVISRQDAANSGRSFFFTGVPCKHGHLALRYVSNAGCLGCLTKYRAKMNPWTTKLVPLATSKLWTLGDFSREERIALRVYLQHCIFTFIRSQRVARDLAYKAELEAAMQEIEERGKFAVGDPRNQD